MKDVPHTVIEETYFFTSVPWPNEKLFTYLWTSRKSRDFIYIHDLIDAIYKAATIQNHSALSSPSEIHDNEEQSGFYRGLSPQPFSIAGQVFQIATNKEHTVNELAKMLEKELRWRGTSMKVDHGPPRRGDVNRNFPDTTKAKRLLSWTADTSLEKGLSQTIEWFLTSSPHSTNS
ncbi:MAG: GDP-mannose 4,6-dehydratase [Deltaproteobacteria bacterium]|nr:GDP-mannose 4,6-dehydratase [Deltaproteobacteria bacterium]